MKMKDEKTKHNHKLTDLLKVCIFGLLMIAPLLASVSQMLYVTLNKNAKDSYYGETINKQENIFYKDLVVNETYYINSAEQTPPQQQNYINGRYYCNNVSINGNYEDYSNVTNFRLYLNSGGQIECLFYSDISTYFKYNLTSSGYIVTFTYLSTTQSGNTLNPNDYDLFYQKKYENYSYLDNAFYYGVDQMTKSDLFNWTQNTAIYTGVKAMTDNLQIQTNAIAILIVYWFILTIIYIIIDIILKCFTTITHMIFRAD